MNNELFLHFLRSGSMRIWEVVRVEVLFFKKEWNLKNGLLIFTFGFWDKKRKLLLWNSLYFSFTLFHLFGLSFEKIHQPLLTIHSVFQSHHRVIWRVI